MSNAAGPPVGAIKVAEIAKDGGVWIRVQACSRAQVRALLASPSRVGSNPEHPTICGRCVDNVDWTGRVSDLRMNADRDSRRIARQRHPLVVDLRCW